MGLTLVEKILSEHAGKEVHADELISEDMIYNYYDVIEFTEDDFFCGKEE